MGKPTKRKFPSRRKRLAFYFAVCFVCFVILIIFLIGTFSEAVNIAFNDETTDQAQVSKTFDSSPKDKIISAWEMFDLFEYSDANDLQDPELPTGCEATAASTLARLNGYGISKLSVADAMPKSNDDFVNSFCGSPYSKHGTAIMSPGMRITLAKFIPEKAIHIYSDLPLDEIPLPAAVWCTMDLVDYGVYREQDGYSLLKASHCVVLGRIDEDTVTVWDPMYGKRVYERYPFEASYANNGMQSLYLDPFSEVGTYTVE